MKCTIIILMIAITLLVVFFAAFALSADRAYNKLRDLADIQHERIDLLRWERDFWRDKAQSDKTDSDNTDNKTK